MVKLPRQPVGLRMTGGAFLLEFTLVDILMAVFAFLSLGLVFSVFMAFLALGINVFPYKREPGLGVVIKGIFFPVSGVMALLTNVSKFAFMDIVFPVAVYAF